MFGARRLGLVLVLPVALVALAPGCHAASRDGAVASADASADAFASCDPGRGEPMPLGTFTKRTIDARAAGAAFAAVADVNGDGRRDIVVSSFGAYHADGASVTLSPGNVAVYYQGASADCWRREVVLDETQSLFFPNEPNVVDVDGDGDRDIVLAAGFFVCAFDRAVGRCGAIVWLENAGGKFALHTVTRASERFFHRAVHVDLDGDGMKDLVTVGESSAGAKVLVFRGDASAERFASVPIEIADGLGSFPVVTDVDGDGALDVAAGEYFVTGESFAWVGQRGGAWTRHVIDATRGRGFMFAAVPNLYGDGVVRFVGTNHVNESDDAASRSGVFVFDPHADRTTPWSVTTLSTGIVSRPSAGNGVQGAPGVFGAGDIDGDGDIDIAVSGDGDARTFWLEQTAPGAFTTRVIETSLGQAGGALVVDVDGDGRNEVVFTGYEDGVVNLYTHR